MANHVAQLDLFWLSNHTLLLNGDSKPTISYVLCYYYALLYLKNFYGSYTFQNMRVFLNLLLFNVLYELFVMSSGKLFSFMAY